MPSRWRALSVLAVAALWVASTWLFWTGYTGADDMHYIRYAFHFDGPPNTWWEYRLPAILAIRASYLLLGPSEFAAAVPTLVASLVMIAAVAWLVDWPRTLTWQSQATVWLAVLLPIDVGFRSNPGAPFIAASLLVLGTVLILKGSRPAQYGGAALLALGFFTHEISLFYVGIFCVVACAVDRQRFWRPVVACVVLSVMCLAAESTLYAFWSGDALARLKTAAATTHRLSTGIDPDNERTAFWFFAWPVQNLIYCKQFGIALGAVFLSGAAGWRQLRTEQRIILGTLFLVWCWLGYGSQVPWAYKPLYRQFHYYSPMILATALLPYTLTAAFGRQRRRLAQLTVAGLLAINVASLTVGGRWGAAVDVSRELLAYAQQHRTQQFVTDVETLNEMYVLNGFRAPVNVGVIESAQVHRGVFVGRRPDVETTSVVPGAVDAVLLNEEQRAQWPFEPDFNGYLGRLKGTSDIIAPVRYRLLFSPLAGVIPMRSFMTQSLGGVVITPQPAVAAGVSAE